MSLPDCLTKDPSKALLDALIQLRESVRDGADQETLHTAAKHILSLKCESILDRLHVHYKWSYAECRMAESLFLKSIDEAAKKLLIIVISGKSQHYDDSSYDRILAHMGAFTASLPEKIWNDIVKALRKQA